MDLQKEKWLLLKWAFPKAEAPTELKIEKKYKMDNLRKHPSLFSFAFFSGVCRCRAENC